jgi:hypothetical protein
MGRFRTTTAGFRRISISLLIALAFVIMTGSVLPAQQVTASSQPFPSACAYTFTSGTGGSLFRFCVTASGNVIYLETGQGVEHIYHGGQGVVEEGYAVCADSNPAPWYYGQYYDTFESLGAYWKFPVLVSLNPLIIDRTTVDDGFRLRQTFFPNAKDQELVIEMKLTNLSKISRTNVVLKRMADLDVDYTHQDDLWDRSFSSVWARNAARNAAVTLRAFPNALSTIPNFAAVEYAGIGYPCMTDSHPTPEVGDYAGHVGALLGTMLPNTVRTLKVKYSPQ